MIHPKCGKSWTGIQREHCSACCHTFNSQYAGDKHRVGDWTSEDPRRCLSEEEMTARGMFERDGIWYGARSDRDYADLTA